MGWPITPNREVLADLLRDCGPLSVSEIAQHMQLTTESIRYLLRILKADKRVRVAAYEQSPNNNNRRALWAIGKAPDAKRPPRKTGAEINREWRARNKADIAIKRIQQGTMSRRRDAQVNPFAGLLPARIQ